jgi:thioesterase domain-containing protein
VSCTIPCCRLKPTSPQPQIIDEQPGPVVPAGHSCGGAVITEAASHEKVAALGYIAAFVRMPGRGSRCDRSRGRPDKVLSAGVDRL